MGTASEFRATLQNPGPRKRFDLESPGLWQLTTQCWRILLIHRKASIRPGLYALAGLSMACAMACSPYKVVKNPSPPIAIADYAKTKNRAQGEQAWWKHFEDPQLEKLIQRGLRHNFELRAAWSRLSQARALLVQAQAGRWPQLSTEASASRQRIQTLFGGFENSLYSLSLAASYELDLFDRIGSMTRAAKHDLRATRLDIEAMALSVSAEIAERWYDLKATLAQKEQLDAQLKLSEDLEKLVVLRFEEGLVSALEVHQQRQLTASLRGENALLEGSIQTLRNQLAVLVGQLPQALKTLQVSAQLPTLKTLPQQGVSGALIHLRPDVRAAQKRVEAADERIAAAVAARFPSIRLSGSLGFSAVSIAEVLGNFVWNILGSVSASLFDGGQQQAEINRSKAVLQERLNVYGLTTIRALTEVENALIQEKQQQSNIQSLEEQLRLSSDSLNSARDNYAQGINDYLTVLSNLRTQYQMQSSLIRAQRQALSHRIALHRALGGTWTSRLKAPKPLSRPSSMAESS